MTVVLRVKFVSGITRLGPYIKKCDVDAHGGVGDIVFTHDKTKAKRFPSVEDAHQFWSRQSTACPYTPDGQPNRPLTAYNVTHEDI